MRPSSFQFYDVCISDNAVLALVDYFLRNFCHIKASSKQHFSNHTDHLLCIHILCSFIHSKYILNSQKWLLPLPHPLTPA
uniref:Ovule protein n=1 Tax=Panagrellus redivivus TaxID=6233 RepID=A0A7E4ZQX9_PANRE